MWCDVLCCVVGLFTVLCCAVLCCVVLYFSYRCSPTRQVASGLCACVHVVLLCVVVCFSVWYYLGLGWGGMVVRYGVEVCCAVW